MWGKLFGKPSTLKGQKCSSTSWTGGGIGPHPWKPAGRMPAPATPRTHYSNWVQVIGFSSASCGSSHVQVREAARSTVDLFMCFI